MACASGYARHYQRQKIRYNPSLGPLPKKRKGVLERPYLSNMSTDVLLGLDGLIAELSVAPKARPDWLQRISLHDCNASNEGIKIALLGSIPVARSDEYDPKYGIGSTMRA